MSAVCSCIFNDAHDGVVVVSVPEQPANLQGAAVSPSEIRLTWDPPPDSGQSVLRYHIYYNDSHLHQNVKVTTERRQTTYTMSDLMANTVYHIRVAAESERGEGSATPTVQVKTDEYGELRNVCVISGVSRCASKCACKCASCKCSPTGSLHEHTHIHIVIIFSQRFF